MRIFFLIFLLVFALGCVRNEQPSEDVLGQQEMINILVDIHLYEALVHAQSMPSDSAKSVYGRIEDEIFLKHNVTREKYDKSYNWYVTNVRYMDKIYGAVVDSLSLREAMGRIKEK